MCPSNGRHKEDSSRYRFLNNRLSSKDATENEKTTAKKTKKKNILETESAKYLVHFLVNCDITKTTYKKTE